MIGGSNGVAGCSARGGLPRPARGPDRIPAGLLDRASPARCSIFSASSRGRQDVRHPDPARRDPGDPLVYFRRLLKIALRCPTTRRRAASSSAFSSPSCRPPSSARAARLHQGRAVQSVDRLRHPDRRRARAPRRRRARLRDAHGDATRFPLAMYFKIGLFQCLAMIPGVSRSGATIVGAMLLGAEKRAAAEFSFFLAMPTMAGAFAYDLLKNYKILSVDGWRDDRGRLRCGFRLGRSWWCGRSSTTCRAAASRPSRGGASSSARRVLRGFWSSAEAMPSGRSDLWLALALLRDRGGDGRPRACPPGAVPKRTAPSTAAYGDHDQSCTEWTDGCIDLPPERARSRPAPRRASPASSEAGRAASGAASS